MTRHLLASIAFLLYSAPFAAQAEVNIIPQPTNVVEGQGQFTLKDKYSIGYNKPLLADAAQYLQDKLQVSTGFQGKVKKGKGTISLVLNKTPNEKDESYTLSVQSKKIIISSASYKGIIHGISSLRQLFPAEIESKAVVPGIVWAAPAVEIQDKPRFEWRGLMLDPVRHFYSVAETERLLDVMALYKFSKFHWHLVDGVGWRIEIKKYPLLTQKSAWRNPSTEYIDKECEKRAAAGNDRTMKLPKAYKKINENDTLYGGFYTQDQIREIVKYASVRGIDIVPEFDVPGHSQAEISAYPWLSCHGDGQEPLCLGSDKSIEFCKDVFKELFQLFPYGFTEIGGDEVNRSRWKGCELCQARIKKESLGGEEELQSWFTREMEKFFNQHGRRLIGWDEILEGGVSPTAIVNWWRGDHTDVVQKSTNGGNEVILCPTSYCYFDYGQDQNTIQRLYTGNIVPTDLSSQQLKLIKGMQANIWGEFIPTEARMQFMVFPRALALAEKAWTPNARLSWTDFEKRMTEQTKRLGIMQINYRPLDADATRGFNN